MSNSIDKGVYELVLKSSAVPGYKNLFVISPFGYRAGFLFQQQKAINLVYSLLNKHGVDRLKKKRIAIIGAGVAGVTAFALLKDKVDEFYLFEAEEEYLHVQKQCDARLVHPNYNRWPMLDMMKNFTHLPKMNWYADDAQSVIKILKEQVKDLELDDSIKTNHSCKKINQYQGIKLKLHFEDEKKSKSIYNKPFDIVILAAGFGPEKYTNRDSEDYHHESYWAGNQDFYYKALTEKPVNIYGTGDGAIIDTIKCWAKEPKEFWGLPLRLISELRENHFLTIISEGNGNSESPKKDEFSYIEKDIQEHENHISPLLMQILNRSRSENNGNEIDNLVNDLCVKEKGFYLKLVKEKIVQNQQAFNFIEEYLKDNKNLKYAKINIKGAYKTPFEPTTAPINKILLAYLIVTDRINYKSCTREQIVDEINDEERSKKEIMMVRLGPTKPPFLKILEGQSGENIYKQSHVQSVASILSSISISDYVPFAEFSSVEEEARAGGDPDSAKAENLEPLVQSFVQNKIDPSFKVNFTGKSEASRRYSFSYPRSLFADHKARDDLIKKKLQMLGGMEKELFGYKVVMSPTKQEISQQEVENEKI